MKNKTSTQNVITGYGLVTPLGNSSWQTFSAILGEQTLARRARKLEEDYHPVDVIRQVGCVNFAQHSRLDPSIIIAEKAAREAIYMATHCEKMPKEPIPCILAASKGAMHALTQAANIIGKNSPGQGMPQHYPSLPAEDVLLAGAIGPHAYLAHHLSQRLNLNVLETIVAACASSLVAIDRARFLLDHCADISKVMVLSVEAAILPLFVHSYQKLGVLPPLDRKTYGGYPLDQSRQGFMLAEIGAAIMIEKTNAIAAGQTQLVNTAVSNHGLDSLRNDPKMAGLSRVAEKIIAGQPIDMIHPHATGTQGQDDHDTQELNVYQKLLGKNAKNVQLYANKGAIGHGLGASGLASIVLACLCAKSNIKPPMPWLKQPICTDLLLSAQRLGPEIKDFDHHAIFATGFGGHVAGVGIRYHR